MSARFSFAITLVTAFVGAFHFGSRAHASPPSKGQTIRYKEIPLHLESGDRLVVSAVNAKIHLRSGDVGEATLKVAKTLSEKAPTNSPAKSQVEAQAQFESATFTVRREGSTVLIEERGPDSKTKWDSYLRERTKTEFVFEIVANSVPVDIITQEGSVKIDGWQEAMTVSLIDGQLTTSETTGHLRLQMQKGSATIGRHTGAVVFDGFGAKLEVTDLDGSLDLTNFGGDSQLTRIKGRVEILTQAGTTSIANSSGFLEFVNGRGAFNLSDFDGQVHGETALGPISLGLKGEPEVDIESEKGNVAVRLPADSGASLQLQSEEGGIITPDEIQTELRAGFVGTIRKPNSTAIVSGLLPGQGPKGRIAVRSKSGAIRIR